MLVHLDALYAVACHVTDDPVLAEDLVVEAVARALREADEVAPDASIRVCLFRALRGAFVAWSSQLAPGPAIQASSGDVARAFRMLADEERWAILLDREGFTDGEAAAVIGCTVTTARARLSHARATLRRELASAS